jgi:AraC-like DNA-binding protein
MASSRAERRVLVVEDNQHVRTSIADALTDAGYTVSHASGPDEALTLLSATGEPAVGVVLVDCLLRSHSRTFGGVQLIRTIDLRWPWIPIVAMTGAEPAEGMIIEVFRHGAEDFLKKPFSLDELVMVVRRATMRRRRPLLQRMAERSAESALPVRGQDAARVAAFIDQHYAEPLKLHDLAARVGLGVVRLRRVFRAATGLSIPEYIVRVRLARAQELLLASDCSMTEIALAVGFYDLPHLDKAFRKWFGISPSDFQRRAGLARTAARPAEPPLKQPRRA